MSTKLHQQQKKQFIYSNTATTALKNPAGLLVQKKPDASKRAGLYKTSHISYSIPSIGLWSGLLKYCIATNEIMVPPKLPISTIARKAIKAERS